VAIGARPRRDAERLALQLAAMCRAIFAVAESKKEHVAMENTRSDDEGQDLLAQVVAACQAAIGKAMAEPSQALGIARGLGAALDALRLVGGEVGKGPGGIAAVTGNADALVRGALEDVLQHAGDPERAAAVLAATASRDILPVQAPPPMVPATSAIHRASGVPTFSENLAAYLTMRIAADGEEHAELKSLRLRARTFLELAGDLPVDQYTGKHLQDYVSEMQYWPGNVTKRAGMAELSTAQIIAGNRNRTALPIARKTLQDGYVANVRTVVRYRMEEIGFRDPFVGVRIRWPASLKPSTPREGIGLDVLDRTFALGTQSGLLDEAVIPLLSYLTGRRLGLLLFLQGQDIRLKHGVYVAQSSGIAFDGRSWQRVPIKTDESMTYFVLHRLLVEIGFVDWAMSQQGWIFAAVHEHPDPAKYLSKVMNVLLRKAGAHGAHTETFHSLRGDAIDDFREGEVDARARRLQVGHELADVHDDYGHKAINAVESQRLFNRELPEAIDWTVFHELDFDALAKARRSRGRKKSGGAQ
jgi:integrase